MDKIITSWQQIILQTQGIKRRKYFNEIYNCIGSKPIKIITGFRRAGKSFLVKQIARKLVDDGFFFIDNILYLNFEDVALMEYLDSNKLLNILENFEINIATSGKKLLIFDEIQFVKNRDRLIRTIYEKNTNNQYEIIITGSNSSLLSSELSSSLAGRFIEFEILPFEFSEFLQYKDSLPKNKNDYLRNFVKINKLFLEFLNWGGLPEIFEINTEDAKKSYLQGVRNKIILDDIIKRFKIRNVDQFGKTVSFVFGNIGNITNIRSIQKKFIGIGDFEISVSQIKKFIVYMQKSFGIYKLGKFDRKLQKIFDESAKYYSVDNGILSVLNSSIQPIYDKKLENIVFLFLKKHFDSEIYFTRNKEGKEIDFIQKSEKGFDKIQVCYKLHTENKKRELGNFGLIDKYINGKDLLVYYESNLDENKEGIGFKHIVEFLLGYIL